jgi:hypothetical protein
MYNCYGDYMSITKELSEYSKNMSEAKLPSWDELPKIPLYCDQMIHFVQDKLTFLQSDEEKPLTKSMVNNYVKWGILPKPICKKYERIHISYMITIIILKKIIPISQIKKGITLQVAQQGNKNAYNAFCVAFEGAMQTIFEPLQASKELYKVQSKECAYNELAINGLTKALANKLLAEKIIKIEMAKHALRFNKKGEKNAKQ